MEPIIGFRYKCSQCQNYNLCQVCEEQNSLNLNHPHNFIKIRNELNDNNNNMINEIINNNNNYDKIEYSYKLINKKMQTYIYQGENEAKISIVIKNNCKNKWPEKKTFLIFDKMNSMITCEDISLKALNPEDQESYDIQFKQLKDLNPQEYKVFFHFNVDGRNYGDKICLSIIIKQKHINSNNSKN